MPRGGPGAADRELIGQLAARGLVVSVAQLERWRRAGLLPRHARDWPGRGRGSVSRLDPETVEIAAALARHARQGRDLRLAVLGWFAEAGLSEVLDTVVPEPPERAVLDALEWVTGASPWYQLFAQARAAQTEAQKDDFYTAADEAVTALPPTAERFDPGAIQAALLSGREPELDVLPVRDSLIQLLAAIGMGYEEVGADVLAEAFSGSGLFPPVSAWFWEQWLARMRQPEAASPLAELLFTRYDPLAMIRIASGEQLRTARKVAFDLAGFGSFCALHAALLPDTPGLAALRETVTYWGIEPMLIRIDPIGHRVRRHCRVQPPPGLLGVPSRAVRPGRGRAAAAAGHRGRSEGLPGGVGRGGSGRHLTARRHGSVRAPLPGSWVTRDRGRAGRRRRSGLLAASAFPARRCGSAARFPAMRLRRCGRNCARPGR